MFTSFKIFLVGVHLVIRQFRFFLLKKSHCLITRSHIETVTKSLQNHVYKGISTTDYTITSIIFYALGLCSTEKWDIHFSLFYVTHHCIAYYTTILHQFFFQTHQHGKSFKFVDSENVLSFFSTDLHHKAIIMALK